MPSELFTFGPNQELIDSLALLEARFIVIGGLAVHYHVPTRQVDDLDLLIEPSVTNAQKLIETISLCPLINHSITVNQLIQPQKIQIPLKIYFYADILTPGSDINFDEEWHQAHVSKIGQTTVKVAAIETLLKLLSQSTNSKHINDIRLLKQCAIHSTRT